MLFNMDRNIKNNLLQMYKMEAEQHAIKKQAERQRKINEEREYLQQIDQKENAREDRDRLEKIRKMNAHLGDYQKMLQQPPQKIKSRIADVKINNYGFNVGGGPSFQGNNRTYSAEPPQSQSNATSFYNPSARDFPQREIDLVRKEDHMGNYLTNKQNEREVNSYFINQKNEQMKYYKDLLDTQVSQNKNTPLSINPNGTIQNANIINHQRRFNLANDPYNQRKNVDFGVSKLDRNPILNPVNNLDYNKYLSFSKGHQYQDQGQAQEPNYNMNRAIDQYQPPQEPNPQSQQPNDFQLLQDQYMGDYRNKTQYQPKQPEQYAPNRMNDYGNNLYQPNDNYQPPLPREYQQEPYKYNDPIPLPREYQQEPYKYNDPIPQPQSMRSNYLQDHTPTPTGQRLIQAGASSMFR